MTIVAEQYQHVIGVDTHAQTHTYAILDAGTGRTAGSATFPTHAAGLARALTWIQRHSTGKVLVAIEGTGSYGANLIRTLRAEGIAVCDVRPPRRASRTGKGKSDEIDAVAAARTALASEAEALAAPRADGIRSALRVLPVARRAIDSRRTGDRNMLTALLRSFNLGIDARKPLTDAQVRAVAAWRARRDDDTPTRTIRDEARRLVASVLDLTRQMEDNHAALTSHVNELAPGLLDIHGVGPVSAAIVLTAYSHKGRVRSEAAFAALAGAAPLPASSGNTVRHRLNRGGDRQLNRALEIVARVRMSNHPATRAYVERRLSEGKTRREIRRCLKRYIARQLFRCLSRLLAEPEQPSAV
ncbi:IS110 family transposase [Arthrobacter humicola]|uniref:IS110 family transposase n=1 Tax=Arthrobacter humicola TaxID=409291 RepID=A0ABN2ZQ83_9MICC